VLGSKVAILIRLDNHLREIDAQAPLTATERVKSSRVWHRFENFQKLDRKMSESVPDGKTKCESGVHSTVLPFGKPQKNNKNGQKFQILVLFWKIFEKFERKLSESVLSDKIKCEIGTSSTASLFDRPKKRVKSSRI
jgi:hypothetical protein